MSDKCPKCGAASTGGGDALDCGVMFDCASVKYLRRFSQSPRCKLTVAERERDSWMEQSNIATAELQYAREERDAAIALLREVQAEAGNQSPVRHALTPSTRDDIEKFLAKHQEAK